MSLIGRPYKQTLCANLLYISFIFANVYLYINYCERKNSTCMQEAAITRTTYPTPSLSETGGQAYFNILRKHFERKGDEWRLSSRFIYASEKLNCSTLYKIDSLQYIAAGWTKTTYKVLYNNQTLSMKIINAAGHDISSCLSQPDRYFYDCFLLAASKLLHEITILHSLSHPNIVKILGYCVPNELDVENSLRGVAIFEEYGEPINVIKMLQLSWEDRLRISLGLTKLLKHLSALKDPVALNDLRRQQFIIVDGEPKLVDVDDVGLQEPRCTRRPCCINASSTNDKLVCVPCYSNICQGYNEKLNILKIGHHFIKHILPYGAPSSLSSTALSITKAYELGSWNLHNILKEMENLTTVYKSGRYRKNTSNFLSEFYEIKEKDISHQFDYRCQLTASGYGCIMSVLDAEEAAEICLSESQCKAFVFTNVFTWTGRQMVHLKNGIGNLIINNATIVYIKR